MNGQKPTAGPWHWIRRDSAVYLGTLDRGMLVVMDFTRLGMNQAQPRFATWAGEERERLGGLMKKAMDFQHIEESPDARLIAAAPDLLRVVKLAEELAFHNPSVSGMLALRAMALDVIGKTEGKATAKVEGR